MERNRPWISIYPDTINKDQDCPKESLNQLLSSAVDLFEKDTAITFYDHRFTFKEVGDIAHQFGSVLYESGMRKGDRLAIMLPNSPHYIFSLFGAFHIGAIAVQVNPMYVERELEYILQDSEAKMMVVYDDFYNLVKKVQPKTKLEKIIVVSFKKSDETLTEPDVWFEDYIKQFKEALPPETLDPEEDVAVLQYTGGTTGLSKGVMLTHQNLRANVEQVYDFMFKTTEFPKNFKSLSVLPMFHIFGLTCNVFQSYRVGSNQVILPRFDLEEVLETVKREKPYQMAGVPTMYVALNSHPKMAESGFDKIDFYNSGGSAMPVEQLHYFEKQTSQFLYEGYGLSEASPVTHFNPPFSERVPGSIGIPVPWTDARAVRLTEHGLTDVPHGEVGELAVKGPQVMKGYWRRPEETKAVLSEEGWLLTGDLTRMDERGYFYIVDRKKDMIVASGYNVYPREIEEVMYQHPSVQEVIVIGVPDPYRGETVKAYVTLKKNETVSEDDLIKFTRHYLAAYKVPRQIEFRDELPKSAVGKLLRRRLRDEEKQKFDSRSSEQK